MIIHNLILFLFIIINLSECYDYQEHLQNIADHRAGNKIKSYGGYFSNNHGHNQAPNNFANSQNHYTPQTTSYQPYGWNFNQPRRTYGGVVTHQTANQPQNPQQYPSNNIGWSGAGFNNYGAVNPSPYFPPLPNFFYPFPQFPIQNTYGYSNPYPNYPNGVNVYPNNGNGPGSFGYGQIPHHPANTNVGIPTQNTGSNNNLHPNQGQLPYPQNNFNQGIPTENTNRNTGDVNNLRPGQLPYPQNNQGIPTVKPITNVDGTSGQGQLPIPQNNNDNQGIKTGNTGGSGIVQPNRAYVPVPQNNFNQGIPTESTTNIPFITQKPITTPDRITTVPSREQLSTTQSITDFNTGEEDFQATLNPDDEDSDNFDVRHTGSNNNNNFASNSFFGMNSDRQWTNEDELKWQATTKAPYFENKVPGLECTLPAAAVLGAENAFKTATLLPLDVPIGKPILSCNATKLLQSNIRLDGKVYGCKNSVVTISCPTHGGIVDECLGQTLECDVKTYNVDKIWCTNGTIVSNSHIVCESAAIMPNQSVVNCVFRNTEKPFIPEVTTRRSVTILPVIPLPNNNNNPSVSNRNEDDFYEIDEDDLQEEVQEAEELMPQVKIAMKNIFPPGLLILPSTNYLPPKVSMQSMNPDLRKQVQQVFNPDLLASARNGNPDDELNNVPSETLDQTDVFPSRNNDQSRNWGEQARQNWNYNSNTNTERSTNDPSKTNTKNRFGGGNQYQNQLQHRLIFTD